MSYDLLSLWIHGSRYGEIPISYLGLPVLFSVFAVIYYLIIGLEEILDNPKQKYLW
ncbi:hypothetical protein [Desulfosporosinus sp.]|uniref:hypothetical protein n=1 Tax=Desulfosporosinus sp. TaxID=157907 RepID=UPI0025BB0B54|nr:hypothetical protein [Desulfosporosinus sp.]MBC2724581.1 hypothetical protein [Desulfosporosinus sp.]MBC2725182.1 hypothetical protein [Desulfosporosinus sp.]